MEQTSDTRICKLVHAVNINSLIIQKLHCDCQFNEDSHTHPPFHCGQLLLHKQHTPSLQCQCYGKEAKLAVDNKLY